MGASAIGKSHALRTRLSAGSSPAAPTNLMKTYGIYDTKDNCWLGDDKGPKVYTDYTIARIAAQVVEDQVFGGLGMRLRYEAREFKNQVVRLKDSVGTKRTFLESLQRIEGYKE